jgi:hypothetical protein
MAQSLYNTKLEPGLKEKVKENCPKLF